MTYRIYALTDDQLDSLLQFLEWVPNAHEESPKQRPECPLPILGDYDNLTRIEPDTAIPVHNVFRDRWERKARWKSYGDYRLGQGRCVKHVVDFPELRWAFERVRRKDQGKEITMGDVMKMRQSGKGPDAQSGT